MNHNSLWYLLLLQNEQLQENPSFYQLWLNSWNLLLIFHYHSTSSIFLFSNYFNTFIFTFHLFSTFWVSIRCQIWMTFQMVYESNVFALLNYLWTETLDDQSHSNKYTIRINEYCWKEYSDDKNLLCYQRYRNWQLNETDIAHNICFIILNMAGHVFKFVELGQTSLNENFKMKIHTENWRNRKTGKIISLYKLGEICAKKIESTNFVAAQLIGLIKFLTINPCTNETKIK